MKLYYYFNEHLLMFLLNVGYRCAHTLRKLPLLFNQSFNDTIIFKTEVKIRFISVTT